MEIRPLMPTDLKDLLRAFDNHGVKYLVVGGYAYGVYAEPRATKDLDIFISSDDENSRAVFQALAQFGAAMEGLSTADFKDGSTFQISLPPARIDLLQRIDGLSFDEAWHNRIQGLIEGEIPINVISRNPDSEQTRKRPGAGHRGCEKVAGDRRALALVLLPLF